MKRTYNILLAVFLLISISSCKKFVPLEKVNEKECTGNKNDNFMLKSGSSDGFDSTEPNGGITDPGHDEDFDADPTITDTGNDEDHDKENR